MQLSLDNKVLSSILPRLYDYASQIIKDKKVHYHHRLRSKLDECHGIIEIKYVIDCYSKLIFDFIVEKKLINTLSLLKTTMTSQNDIPQTFSILYILPDPKFNFLKLTLDQNQDPLMFI